MNPVSESDSDDVMRRVVELGPDDGFDLPGGFLRKGVPKCRTCLDKGWYWQDGVQMGCEHREEEPAAPPPPDLKDWLKKEET